MTNTPPLPAGNAGALPRWDVSTIFPSLESDEFARGFRAALDSITALADLFAREGIERRSDPPTGDALGATAERVLTAYNATLEQVNVVRAFISSFVATDSRNTTAQARMSELRRAGVTMTVLGTRFTAWVGSIDVEALIASSDMAREHAYFLRETRTASARLLSAAEEELAADLHLSGGSAWAKLHGDLTSQITVPLDGRELPMSVIRALASDGDRATRERAYHAELAAWERAALPLCAAMNGIKHESGIMSRRRGWDDVLDVSLFYNKIDRATLTAMMDAARESFPDFRRYLRAKARAISGAERLPWFDLFAPIGTSSQTWSWTDAEAFIEAQFGTYSPKLRDFAVRAFRERWIDAEPRPGKRDGAFCMGVRPGESRIMQNYKPSFDGVSTLAHELGHGYHNLCLQERRPLQRSTPMTLAETASIFCETVIRQAVLNDGDFGERLSVLEDSLQGSCQVVVDITSRFLFEQRVIEKRRERELSVDEMCELMREAQSETYGDGIDADAQHPFMWAVKGHYYGSSFYNFPYMFGLLFGLGLYAIFESNPEEFRDRYDALLSRTGMASSVELAREFGIEIREKAFWTSSLAIVRRDVDRFEELLAQQSANAAARA
jgi:oligoendopeptidase F